MPTPEHHDVLIAGAGPVGLLLACELRLAGCSVQVFERANRLRR
ncbi:FAD-dependent oxidoreductase [Burkholderia gladioli]